MGFNSAFKGLNTNFGPRQILMDVVTVGLLVHEWIYGTFSCLYVQPRV